MEGLALRQPELVGREEELDKLSQSLDNAISGKGSTVLIAGEAGIGKTRLVSELKKAAESNNVNIVQGWCLAESLEPLMPVKSALREAGLLHLVSSEPPPLAISAYLMNDAGKLIAKAEREEMDLDSDIFAGMLQAVGDFVQDSLSMMAKESGGGLNTLGYDNYTIFIQTRGALSLAIVIRGEKSEFLIDDMKQLLEETGDEFQNWDGEVSDTIEIQNKVKWFVESGKYNGKFLVDDPKIKQENLFDNVLLGIQRASAEKPLLIFLDDMQWADPTTLNLLHYISRNTIKNNILILGTYRPEDVMESEEGKTHPLETTLQNMSREDLFGKIELKRLGLDETRKIIRSALGSDSFGDDFFAKIHREAGGTPFFVLEVLKLLIDSKAISQDEDGIWNLVTDIDALNIPSKVYDVIKRRLDRLMIEQKEILECASVIGEEFGSEVVGKMAGLEKLQVLKNLSEIEKTHKLVQYMGDNYRFDHAKIREVLYDGIGGELRKEYHRMAGDKITELHKDNQDEVINVLAYHYYEAGDGRAGEYLVRAGDAAKERYANEEAIKLFTDALEYVDGNKKLVLLEKLADVQALTGKYDLAIENFEKAEVSTDDSETRANMLRKIGSAYEKMGDYDKSLEVLAKAKVLAVEGKAGYGRILLAEGHPCFGKGEFERAMILFKEAINLFEETGVEKKDIGNALRAIGNIHSSKGEYESALENYERSLAVMKEIDDKYGIAASLNNIGSVHYARGEQDITLKYLEYSLEIMENIGDKQGVARLLGNIGNVHNFRGELDKALESYERSLVIMETIGDKQGIAILLSIKGNMHLRRGELDKALEFYKRSLEIYENIGDKEGIANLLNSIGDVHLSKGEQEKALKFYESCLRMSEEIGDKNQMTLSLCGLAETNLGLKNTQAAQEYAEKAVAFSLETGNKLSENKSRRVLGMCCRETGNLAEAEEEFLESISISEDIHDIKEVGRAHYEYGLLLGTKDEIDNAREHLEKALPEFERMGMKLWEEKARKALEDLN